MKAFELIGIAACAFLALCCVLVVIGTIFWLFKEDKPEKIYMDNDEFDFGHNVKHNEE